MPSIKGVRSLGDSDLSLAQEKMIATYALEWLVIADNTSQGPVTIRSTTGLPLVGISTYSFSGETDLSAICKRKTCKQDAKQRRVWYVTTLFDNDPSSQSQEDEQNQPGATNRPLMLEWDSEYGERVLYQDFSSTPRACVSSNGERFDPPLTTPIVYPVLNVTRYQTTFSVATKLAYENKVNSALWNGAVAYSVLCTSIRAVQVVEDGTRLWRVTFRFRYNPLPDGYKSMPLNQGTYRLTTGTPAKLPFMNNGVPYIANLSANGQAEVAAGSETYGGLNQLGFKTFQEANFAGLGLTF